MHASADVLLLDSLSPCLVSVLFCLTAECNGKNMDKSDDVKIAHTQYVYIYCIHNCNCVRERKSKKETNRHLGQLKNYESFKFSFEPTALNAIECIARTHARTILFFASRHFSLHKHISYSNCNTELHFIIWVSNAIRMYI